MPLRVRTLVSLCVTCHARERAAADFDGVRRAVDSLGLSPFERAQYLAATRQFDASAATPDALFKKAKALLDKADGQRTLLADDSTDVVYLRASGYLNLALALNPRLASRGEALYLLGLRAAALKSPLLWDVDLLYFEACVRENPRTKLAQRCFRQLSERLYFGFTGSAGTNIPEDEAERLAALRKLAE